jgi:DNA topoisomerase I
MSRAVTQPISLLPTEPRLSAQIIGLEYVRDTRPGIRRRRAGKGFVYIGPDARLIRNSAEVHRIRSLVIPPAWTDVWICPNPNGHLQAVGRDAKGRKQYRYHARYRQVREHTKFERMVPFASLLPGIRAQVRKDLRLSGYPKVKILAAIVQLLETTCIRVGNEEYTRQNDSFGLTTLLNRHVRVTGDRIRFHFKGKSGQVHDIELRDPQLAKIVKRCHSLPGQELFQYIADHGKSGKINSEDVNDYLRGITGEDFTAKDFRTWAGTREAARLLYERGPASKESEAKRVYVDVVKQVSQKLGNRPATTKKHYIHPAVWESYTDGSLFDVMASRPPGNSAKARRIEELNIVALILKHTEIGQPPKQEPDTPPVKRAVSERAARAAKIATIRALSA